MFPIPALQDLVLRTARAFNALVPGVDALIRPNNVEPTAKSFAGMLWELFNRLSWVGKQAFVLWAEGTYLDKHGQEYNLPRLGVAPAAGLVDVTATDVLTIPQGTQFTLSNNVAYQSTAAAQLTAAGTVSVPVSAVTPGAAGNALPGAALTISAGSGAGLSGNGAVGATAAVDAGGISDGTDVEQDGRPGVAEAYRGRILFRKQNPPQGGAPADYVQWASAVPGVTRVFVERCWRGPGTVRIFPIFDQIFASTGGIADSAHIALVANAIALKAPSDAQVTVVAPTSQVIPVTVHGLNPSSTSTQNAVLAELQAAFLRNGRVSGADPATGPIAAAMPYLAVPATFSLSWIWQAVTDAVGVTSDAIQAPTADTAIPAGYLPVLGAITYT